MSDLQEQMRTLQLRMDRLEEALLSVRGARQANANRPAAPPTHATAPVAEKDTGFLDTTPQAMPGRAQSDARSSPFFEPQKEPGELSVTQIMGWAGATLLVLAAAYLIRLVYDVGWLTPVRQLGLAVLGGAALMAAGFGLRRVDRGYASLLPAGGLVVFFLAIYGAHLYYHLIGPGAAAMAVMGNCLLALWLGRRFASEVYGLFAVAGSYSAPLLLPAFIASTTDLAIYFTAWSLVFCTYAIGIANRRPYLLAGYLALLAFQLAWEAHTGREQWGVAVAFQTLQFLVFLGAAIFYSIRHKSPMTQAEGAAHLPLLLLFYALQYALLHRHAPALAPWVALGSAAVLLLAYGVARRALGASLQAGGFIVGAYCAMVLFHAVYLELLPDHWAPWAVVLALPPAALLVWREHADAALMRPFRFLLGVLLAINYLREVVLGEHGAADGNALVALLQTLELYAAYFLARQAKVLHSWGGVILYAAHVGLMLVAARELHNTLLVSLLWGVLALAALLLAFRTSDQDLGKSSLLVFGALLAKVILFDLAGAAPLLRIGSLVVVGVSLYAGGILYKRVMALER